MKIKDVAKKVADGGELSDAEKEFLSSYEEPDVDAVANARGKKERLKLEKKLADKEAEMAELQSEVEAAAEGSSELDKLQKQLEKANAKIEKAEAELTKERETLAATTRANALKSLNVSWMDDVPSEYRDTVLTTSFNDIDTDDLSDASVTKPILDKLIETQARFISSGVQGGAGSGKGESGHSTESKKWTREKINAAIADGTYGEHADAIKQAVANGIE